MADTSAIVPYETPGHSFGESSGETLKNIANSAAGAICGLYQAFPGFMSGRNFNSPFADFNDGLMDDLCRPRNQLPPSRSKPFNGGQCVGRQYRVFQTVSQPPQADAETSALVFGPVIGLITDRGSDGQGRPTKSYRLEAGINAQGQVGTYQVSGPSSNPGFNIVITSVVAENGQPDNCGDIVPRYPNDNPGGALVNFNTSIQVTPTVNVMVPVKIFAPITTIVPTLRLGDINVTVGLGGLHFDFSNNVNTPGSPAPVEPQPQPEPGNGVDETNKDLNIEEILKYLKRLRECQECDLDYNFLSVTSASANSGSITVPSTGIPTSVGFQILEEPSNPKLEPGNSQPDVLYAGWSWFDGNGYVSTRNPIDARLKLFTPVGETPAQSFRWTLRVGYVGKAILRYKVLKNPLPSL